MMDIQSVVINETRVADEGVVFSSARGGLARPSVS